jgi:hypothetical protein
MGVPPAPERAAAAAGALYHGSVVCGGELVNRSPLLEFPLAGIEEKGIEGSMEAIFKNGRKSFFNWYSTGTSM